MTDEPISEGRKRATELLESLTGAITAVVEHAIGQGVQEPVGAVVCTTDGPVETVRARIPICAMTGGVWLGAARVEDLRALADETGRDGIAKLLAVDAPDVCQVLYLGGGTSGGAFGVPVTSRPAVAGQWYPGADRAPVDLPFTASEAPTVIVRATGIDGAQREVRLALTVLRVIDTGVKDADGSTVLDVHAAIVPLPPEGTE